MTVAEPTEDRGDGIIFFGACAVKLPADLVAMMICVNSNEHCDTPRPAHGVGKLSRS